MVNLAEPMATTSLRGLAFLVWPKNGVALTTVVELAVAAIDAIFFNFSKYILCLGKCGYGSKEGIGCYLYRENENPTWVANIAQVEIVVGDVLCSVD